MGLQKEASFLSSIQVLNGLFASIAHREKNRPENIAWRARSPGIYVFKGHVLHSMSKHLIGILRTTVISLNSACIRPKVKGKNFCSLYEVIN